MLRRRCRTAFTLVELLSASAAATLLMGGLASSLYIASRALPDDSGPRSSAMGSPYAVGQIVGDLRYARRFFELTSRSVAFETPDRNGDQAPERVRYAWSGVVGEPLTYEFNDEPAIELVRHVDQFDLTALTRQLEAQEFAVTPSIPVVFEEFTEAKLSKNGTYLWVNRPADTQEGDLLIAAVAIDSDSGADPYMPAGWQPIVVNKYFYNGYYYATLGVFWKIAGASEANSYSFDWTYNQQAYGWIMRFTGHHPTAPVQAYATAADYLAEPASPAVTTTTNNCLVLRLGAFDDDDIDVDAPGVPAHTAITMDKSKSGDDNISGGAAYAYLPMAGDAGASHFTLTDIEQFVTTTLAIQPEFP
ncbi:MAG: hypothetical protein KDA61_18090 [Planctomycetales bacterium]|nr:hypothetical protein [Planctomycetales bacterium]